MSGNQLSEDSQRMTSTPSTLNETRDGSRVLGCVGFSIVAHVCFLATLALFPESVKELKADPTGAVSLLESGVAASGPVAKTTEPIEITVTEVKEPAAQVPVQASQEDAVVVPAPKVIEKPLVKPVAKTTAAKPKAIPKALPVAKVKTAPVITDEAETTAVVETPVEKPTDTQEDAPNEKSETPVAAVVDTSATPSTKDKEEIANEDEKPEAIVAATAVAETQPEVQPAVTEAPAKTLPAKVDPQPVAKQAAVANEGSGNGGGGAGITGPIRDASDLRALSGNPNPVYPARDRLARREGVAVILGQVLPDGRIGKLAIEQSSGSAEMDAASVQAFKRWRFQPGQQGWVRKPFQFQLIGDAQEVPAQLGKTLKR